MWSICIFFQLFWDFEGNFMNDPLVKDFLQCIFIYFCIGFCYWSSKEKNIFETHHMQEYINEEKTDLKINGVVENWYPTKSFFLLWLYVETLKGENGVPWKKNKTSVVLYNFNYQSFPSFGKTTFHFLTCCLQCLAGGKELQIYMTP